MKCINTPIFTGFVDPTAIFITKIIIKSNHKKEGSSEIFKWQ